MYFEALGSAGRAEELYKKELEQDPHNATVLKRMIAVKKSTGDLSGAAESLKNYLVSHLVDLAGWEELTELYLQLQMYQQAAFCIEELLLQQPANVAHHLLYADTLYTMGGAQNWKAARTSYSGGCLVQARACLQLCIGTLYNSCCRTSLWLFFVSLVSQAVEGRTGDHQMNGCRTFCRVLSDNARVIQ